MKASLAEGKSLEQALQIYVNGVEGDVSELPIPLAEYADRKGWLKKKPHWWGEMKNVPEMPPGHDEYIMKLDYQGETQTNVNIGDKSDVAKQLYNSRGRYDNIRVLTRKFQEKKR